MSELTVFLDTIAAGGSAELETYDVPDLYLAALPESSAKLLTGFKSAPFVDPASSLVYLRNRWYSPADGNFLTPDPLGAADSSEHFEGQVFTRLCWQEALYEG